MTTTILSHTAVQLALRTRLQTVSGLPSVSYEGKAFTPATGTAYVAESLVPATQTKVGISTEGTCWWTGLYVVTYYGLQNHGLTPSTMADAVLAKFAPALTVTATDGTVIRIRSNPAPWRNQVRVMDGRAVVTINVPYEIIA